MVGHFEIRNCPGCKKQVDTLYGGVWSGLGPPRYRCSRCGLIFNSERFEWADMDRIGKTRYTVVSLVYVGVGGIVGGITIAAAFQFLRLGPWVRRFPLDPLEFGLGAFVCAVLTAAIQIARVFRSLERSRENEWRRMDLGNDSKREVVAMDEPCRPTWDNVKLGLIFLITVGPMMLGWLIAFVRTL
jgi:hypothetical protein